MTIELKSIFNKLQLDEEQYNKLQKSLAPDAPTIKVIKLLFKRKEMDNSLLSAFSKEISNMKDRELKELIQIIICLIALKIYTEYYQKKIDGVIK